jgi:hypothetical protein
MAVQHLCVYIHTGTQDAVSVPTEVPASDSHPALSSPPSLKRDNEHGFHPPEEDPQRKQRDVNDLLKVLKRPSEACKRIQAHAHGDAWCSMHRRPNPTWWSHFISILWFNLDRKVQGRQDSASVGCCRIGYTLPCSHRKRWMTCG